MCLISIQGTRKCNNYWLWREKTKIRRRIRFFTLFVDESQTTNSIICSPYANISSNKSSNSLVEALSIDEETNRITELNTMIKEESVSRTTGHTSISNHPTKTYTHRLGSIPPNDTQEIQIHTLPEISLEVLTSLFTWQTNNDECTTRIQEQGNISSVRWNVKIKKTYKIVKSFVNRFKILSNITVKFFKYLNIIIKPLTINLHDALERSITSWIWNLGDGTSNASCTYSTTGSYVIKLTIGNGH